MTFKVDGVEVGIYETNQTHADFYDYQASPDPNAQGLVDRGLWVNSSEVTAYVFAHKSNAEGTTGIGIWEVRDESNSTETFGCRIEVVNLADKFTEGGFVFVEGQGIDTSSPGEHDYVFAKTAPVNDDGDSSIVFESGTGLGFANVNTYVEDEAESFGTSVGDDSYSIRGTSAVANHLWGAGKGDGVIWPLPLGSYSLTVAMENVDDGREDDIDYDFPTAWYGVGPSGSVDAGSAGPGTSVTVDVDI